MAKAVTTWKPGQSGNPKGRPKDNRTIQVLKNDLELAVREQLTPAKVTRVVNRLLEIATEGEEKHAVAAGKVIIDMAISKGHVQEGGEKQPRFTVVIENATIAALQQKAEHQQEPIEAKYETVVSAE